MWLIDGEIRPVGSAEWGTRPPATRGEWTAALKSFIRNRRPESTLFYATSLFEDGTVDVRDFPELAAKFPAATVVRRVLKRPAVISDMDDEELNAWLL